MKSLVGALTFVNFATVCGVLFGLAAGGLSGKTAITSSLLGLAAAIIASLGVYERGTSKEVATISDRPRGKRRRGENDVSPHSIEQPYSNIWLWLAGACFAIFAFRSFCWLIFADGNELKIQSPNNLGDLALHMTYIRNFANGVALWPDNPIYVFSKLRYPVGMDIFNALLTCLGIDLVRGLIWTGLLGSLATFYAFWRWSGTFGVAGFLFNGGLVGFQVLWTLKWINYQDLPSIAWKSIPLTMLVTQRGCLYAIPAGLLLLYQWQKKFFPVARAGGPGSHDSRRPRSRLQQAPLPFWVECSLYASMPLFHLHTFIALSIALGFWFFVCNPAARKELFLLAGCAFLPAVFFVWLITDHFHAGSILGWQVGWVQNKEEFAKPFFLFWLVNFGLLLPLVFLLFGLSLWRGWQQNRRFIFALPNDLAFLIPAAAIFIIACLVKLAPWAWDNIKLIMWSYFMVLPFLWKDLIARWSEPIRVGICLALFGSGFVNLIGGLAAGRPGFGFADREEVNGVEVAVKNLPAAARFVSYPTYDHPLLLNGRKVVLGYPGHLWTQGFDVTETEKKVTSLMNGTPSWREIARNLRARYVFWGREEKINYPMSTRPWEQSTPCVASGSWGAIYDLEPAQGSFSDRR